MYPPTIILYVRFGKVSGTVLGAIAQVSKNNPKCNYNFVVNSRENLCSSTKKFSHLAWFCVCSNLTLKYFFAKKCVEKIIIMMNV
jgi:hypothetical protein